MTSRNDAQAAHLSDELHAQFGYDLPSVYASDSSLVELLTRLLAASEHHAESQRSLTTLLANLPGMAYRCLNDPDWTTEFVSEGCFELTGYPGTAFTSHQASFGDLIHPEDRQRLWEDTQAALAEGRPFQQTYRITTAANEEKWVWEQGCGVIGPDGNVVALEGFITDITERKRAERALEAGASQYRQMFEQNRAIQMLVDPATGAIVEANQAARDFYGYDAETLRTMTVADISTASIDEGAHRARAHSWSSAAVQHRPRRDRASADRGSARAPGAPRRTDRLAEPLAAAGSIDPGSADGRARRPPIRPVRHRP